ncbi:MAG: helix-turn-helix domain-containing protein [Candidatus Bathyarchaeia archaeon]
MTRKEFCPPWLIKHTVVCPICGPTETFPIWPWERQPDKISELQRRFCHKLDVDFLEMIPVLTANNWKSKQRMDEFEEYMREIRNAQPQTEKPVLNMQEVFQKHGIIGLIGLSLYGRVRDSDLKTISILLCHEKLYFTQSGLKKILHVSKSQVSTILKRLREWNLVTADRADAKGRARGRQLAYALDSEAFRRLNQDLAEHDFFREAVVQVVTPIVEAFPGVNWREDISWPNRQSIDPHVARTDTN